MRFAGFTCFSAFHRLVSSSVIFFIEALTAKCQELHLHAKSQCAQSSKGNKQNNFKHERRKENPICQLSCTFFRMVTDLEFELRSKHIDFHLTKPQGSDYCVTVTYKSYRTAKARGRVAETHALGAWRRCVEKQPKFAISRSICSMHPDPIVMEK